ncbi:hypothetical protein AM2_092 [Lactococcus phage AM2]|uniref:Uncharacterized protein n=7 Tax=Audreyjarvisvirus AM1 TaxID=2845188 RepID=A0A1W6JLQ3_9CAUD|nr:hypothetical protein H1Z30_gp093 [Lactococcus phage AM1]ARM66397.1 hypothetical protein AM2_092 [Lactococcus phage AM2]ARM66574.1 hypothetical protein AM3_092 [Lactococcus phage AM3]ARM67127.1 hypothetical protein AM8_092 [Lactococcus phage AM8]ARM67306.1 hypothetical protein AM9_093 [Lactococcus phage AM9]ARM67484.1 hypothetical protein AM11_092 [Lactococcus phage AM11]ARQ95672.1 hypothetical protein AM12_093 [Lactococcus phage AM12]
MTKNTKNIEYQTMVEEIILGRRIVVIVPDNMQDYSRLNKKLVNDGVHYANLWLDLHMPKDRINIIKLSTSNGREKLNLKPLTFLVVTDPYTMEALEVYAGKSDILYVGMDGKGNLLDVTDNLEYIYDQFFQPFQYLDEVRGDLED